MFNPLTTVGWFYLEHFFYGTAFLVLGLSITVTNMKESNLRLADSLWLLGLFGYTQGVRELMRVYPLLADDEVMLSSVSVMTYIATILLIISFLFLLRFGVSLVSGGKRGRSLMLTGIPVALFSIWVIAIMRAGMTSQFQLLQQIGHAARDTLGFFGGLTAAWGLILYSREIKDLSKSISRHLFFAGLAFASYSIFVTSIFFHFVNLYRIRPQGVFRGTTAFLITYFIIKALNIFNVDMRRRVEKQSRHLVQAEKMASLGRLASGVAHEINNPLTNASLGIQTLRGKLKGHDAGPEVEERLQAVEKNIDRAAAIAQELLQFSRKGDERFTPLNINKIIQSSLTLMKYKLNGVVVKEDLAPVPDILGDAAKLEQVFINIISNALEAMPEKGVLAIATVARGDMVETRISDTGTGIAEENLSRVFEPFFTTKEVGSGTGLGLSICYGIVKNHNGDIELTSAAGKGTTVTIKIPIQGSGSEK